MDERADAADDASRLFLASVSRKRADQDAVLLQNRIKLLRAEEAKANKKIEDTKAKIDEISTTRRRSIAEREKRQNDAESRERNANNQAVKNSQLRNNTRKKIMDAKSKVESRAHGIAHEVRSEKEKLQEALNESRKEEQQFNQKLFEQAQKKKAQTRSAREAQLSETKMRAKLHFENKIEEEDRMRVEKEKMIEKMEQEEIALIQRLQFTQQRQKQMYDQLADVVSGAEVVVTPRLKATPQPISNNGNVELYSREKPSKKPEMDSLNSMSQASQLTTQALTDESMSRPSSQSRDKPMSAKTTASSSSSKSASRGPAAKDAPKRVARSNAVAAAVLKPTVSAADPDNAPASAEKSYTTVDGQTFKIQALLQPEELELASVLNGAFG